MLPNRSVRALLPRRSVPATADPSAGFGASLNPAAAQSSGRDGAARAENSIVDSAVYRDGRRVASPATLAQALDCLPEPGSMAWIGMYRPTDAQLHAAAEQFGLHELAVEDAIAAHQRPKLEVYGDTLFVVMKTAQFVGEHVAMGETCFFIGKGYVISVRHGPSMGYADVRARCENAPEKLKKGEDFIVYALMDFIVDRYFPIIDHLEELVEDLEERIFAGKEERDALDYPLWPIARSAADLLVSADVALVHECASDVCSWLFVDRSPGRRRRWCDMKVCGNRAKARRFYQRRRKKPT